ncbi:hypothetical protein [Rhodanobacter sp. T12-5]|uniref:hypothetical protein n=1 Tax=Rhodanobacter sp. T12-5 TaxID=2024611 RepID=UPI0011EF83B7|nr:hypothetical protein [Rhodanobacter sp. T12-5]KAA0068500.1 hypothetical protein CIW53_16520 [Rhodanobacter sp. T12-5]
MDALEKNAPCAGASSSFVPFGVLSEEEQIDQLIKLYNLPPVLGKSKVLWVTGDTKHDFYAWQDESNADFDPAYPKEIGGRRSQRAPRRYWTVDVLRWMVRRASRANRWEQLQ